MNFPKIPWCSNLRRKCFIIGYMTLFASIVDICCHLLIVAILTNGFECDVDTKRLNAINWSWLEPILVIINIGTHGFYPFPMVLHSHQNIYVEYMKISIEPKCYPGMLHVYLFDILNFLINVIWLKFVLSYVGALHKKDAESMRMFFGISMLKLAVHIMFFAYQPVFRLVNFELYWFVKIIDICIAAYFLIIINAYIKELKRERTAPKIDLPPSYIECLINGVPPTQSETKDVAVTLPEEEKKDAAENAEAKV